jgi:hypothetical protein
MRILIVVMILLLVVIVLRYVSKTYPDYRSPMFHDRLALIHEAYGANDALNDELHSCVIPSLLEIITIKDLCVCVSDDHMDARILLMLLHRHPRIHYVAWMPRTLAPSCLSYEFVEQSRDTFMTVLHTGYAFSENFVMMQRCRFSFDMLYHLSQYPGIDTLLSEHLGVEVRHPDTSIQYSYLFTIYCQNNLSPPKQGRHHLSDRKGDVSKPMIIQTWVTHDTDNEEIWECHQQLFQVYPDNPYMLFSDFEMKRFIRSHYDDSVCQHYDNIVPTAFKSDFFRYLFLYKYGGMYLDITVKPVENVFTYLKEKYSSKTLDFISARDNGLRQGIWNGLMIATRPGDKIMRGCIEKIMQTTTTKNNMRTTGCLEYTGPALLGKVVQNMSSIHERVFLLEFHNSMYICDPETKQVLFRPKNSLNRGVQSTRRMYRESQKNHYSAHCFYNNVFLYHTTTRPSNLKI